MAYAVGSTYEATLDHSARRQGAHYTPPEVAEQIAALALDELPAGTVPTRVLDPACGGGVFLVAVAELLVRRGVPPTDAVACLRGVDSDPGAVGAAREAIAAWADAYGVRSGDAEVRVGDGLSEGLGRADLVIGNPPFQGQLAADTTRGTEATARLRGRFGPEAVAAYVDSALLFLLAGAEVLNPGGVLAMVQPWSSMSTSHGAPARDAILRYAALEAAWVPTGRVFDAEVEVWAPILRKAAPSGRLAVHHGSRVHVVAAVTDGTWAAVAAAVGGVPSVEVGAVRRVADVADTLSGFRDEYYAVAANLEEAGADPGFVGTLAGSMHVVTSGAIDPFTNRWGIDPLRIAKQRWLHPVVRLGALDGANERVGRWARRQHRPKVVVANQTRVVEAVADEVGDLLALTPSIAAIPRDPSHAEMLAVALSAPCLSALLHHRRAGSGQSRGALRLSAADVADLPIPDDWDALAVAVAARRGGLSWREVGRTADAAYGVDEPDVLEWWLDQLPKRISVSMDSD